MKRVEEAVSLFKEGFNCAQSLLAVYGTALGLERDLALKIAAAFGGGIGRMRETCGVVTGALMIIGLKFGSVVARDTDAKKKTYACVHIFVTHFKARNKSLKCGELLGFDITSHPEAKNRIAEQCPQYVKDAALIIEDIL